MTTYANELPAWRDVLAMKLHRSLTKKQAKASKASTRGMAVLNATIRVVLHLAGFGLLTMAGFTLNMLAGLIVAGVSCFVMSTLMTRTTATESTEVNRAPDLRTGR